MSRINKVKHNNPLQMEETHVPQLLQDHSNKSIVKRPQADIGCIVKALQNITCPFRWARERRLSDEKVTQERDSVFVDLSLTE